MALAAAEPTTTDQLVGSCLLQASLSLGSLGVAPRSVISAIQPPGMKPTRWISSMSWRQRNWKRPSRDSRSGGSGTRGGSGGRDGGTADRVVPQAPQNVT
jgi:hypothetical protein